MIILVTGAIGSGKTHNTIRHELLPALKAGRNVITNIDGLNPRRVAQYLGLQGKNSHAELSARLKLVNDETLLRICQLHASDGTGLEIPSKTTVIVDEAQMVWNSREFKKTGKAFIDLLAYSRHHDIDFVFMTQHAKLLEVVITRLANQFQVCQNLGFLGSLASKGYKVSYKRGLDDRPDYTTAYTYDLSIFSLYQSSKVPEAMRSGRLPTQVWLSIGSAVLMLSMAIPRLKNNSMLTGPKQTESPIVAALPSPVVSSTETIANAPVSNVGAILEALKEYDTNNLKDSLISAELVDSPPKHLKLYSNKPPNPNGYVMKNTIFH